MLFFLFSHRVIFQTHTFFRHRKEVLLVILRYVSHIVGFVMEIDAITWQYTCSNVHGGVVGLVKCRRPRPSAPAEVKGPCTPTHPPPPQGALCNAAMEPGREV